MLEIYFSQLFSNFADLKACFKACKIRSPFFFMSIPTSVSTSVLNDSDILVGFPISSHIAMHYHSD